MDVDRHRGEVLWSADPRDPEVDSRLHGSSSKAMSGRGGSYGCLGSGGWEPSALTSVRILRARGGNVR